MSTDRRWLTIHEAAALLSINPKTASAWCLTHRLPAARIGGRGPWRVDRVKLEENFERQIKDNGTAVPVNVRPPLRAPGPPGFHRGRHERTG
jgi:excisionase family DNA binding protein